MRVDALFVATVGYLLLPNAVFAAGWLRPAWGYAIVVVLLACFVDVARRARTDAPPLLALDRLAVAGLAAFWVAASGIGEVNVQVSDYVKHNLVLHDLAVEPWPVIYGGGSSGSLLCYYLAYYLPPALVGKLAGLSAVAPASLAWGAAGVVLAFLWVARLGRPRGAAVLALFTVIDGLCWTPGLCYLAHSVLSGTGAPPGGWWQTGGFTERFWEVAGPGSRLFFQSEPSHLVWTPQHALGAWLATACVLSVVWERRRPAYALLLNAAVLLWSPFVAVGLLPFTAAALWRRGLPDVSWADLAGGMALAAPVALYFLAHGPYRHFGVLLAALPDAVAWGKYALFLALAIGALGGMVCLVQRRYRLLGRERWLTLGVACATLVVTTVITLGKYNDWTMRVSMPGLYVLHLTVAAVAVALWRSNAPLRQRVALAAFLLLAAVRPLKIYVLAPSGGLVGPDPQTTIVTARATGGLTELRDAGAADVAQQYLGSTTSWFARHVMREARDR